MPKTRIKSRCLDDLNDQERLQDRLEWEGYTEIKMKSDGNCQFRALADQLYETSDLHKRVRQEIVKQLKSRPKGYKGFVDKMEFSQYVKNMSSDSAWGDEVTLKAAADVYGVKIVLITSIKDNPTIVILPKSEKEPGRVIHLSYLAGIHYNSIHLNKGSDTTSMGLQRNNNKKEKKKNEKEEKEEQKNKANEENKENNKEKKNQKENKNKKGLHRQFDYSHVM
ncbi:OVARIAN TUMOR DOMAIN-containing deubiquitinating enzyme 10 [Cardamine amara subsp. amara]|uniref:OVARIAN TUMOR DOMAIN-containing deubiquitinating enzyme 10 n=1 Tax=Cardamine amara subsp. amara TaxID=228776 RepID=A0ABD1BAE4_CARAN